MKLKSFGDAGARVQNLGLNEAEAEALIIATAQAAYDEVEAAMRHFRSMEVERVRSQAERDTRQAGEAAAHKARHEAERVESLARTAELRLRENA